MAILQELIYPPVLRHKKIIGPTNLSWIVALIKLRTIDKNKNK